MITNKENGQRGAALVEFTLVIPLLLLFLFGLIEFSIILYDKAVVTNASREAAREWITYKDDSIKLHLEDVKAIVEEYIRKTPSKADGQLISFGGTGLSTKLYRNGVELTAAGSPLLFARGDALKVEVFYNYNFFLLPGLAQSLLPTLTLKGETIMRAE
jgi:hypothetical protein